MYRSKLSFNLEGTTEFQNWEDTAKDLRNDIVHEGYEPTQSEAVEAVKINNRLVVRIKSEFKEDLSDYLLSVKKLPDDGIGRTTLGDE